MHAGRLKAAPTGWAYQPLQSNLNPHFKHLMQPLTLARSRDSPHRGHVVASSDDSIVSGAGVLVGVEGSLGGFTLFIDRR